MHVSSKPNFIIRFDVCFKPVMEKRLPIQLYSGQVYG